MSFFDLVGFGPKGWGLALLAGTLLTLLVSIAALLIGSLFGALIAWAKLSKNLLANIIGDAYSQNLAKQLFARTKNYQIDYKV